MYEFDIFNTENYFSDYARNKYEQLYNEIRNQPEDYILNVDETKYFDYLLEKYESDLITFYFDKGSIQNSVPPNRSGAVLQESRILFCGEEIMVRSHCLQFAQS